MKIIAEIIIALAAVGIAWFVLYTVTAGLPGCRRRTFLVFYREVRERRVYHGCVQFQSHISMSLGKVKAIESELSRPGGRVSITGYHLVREQNMFPEKCLAMLVGLAVLLWLPLAPAWDFLRRGLTRTADDAVREHLEAARCAIQEDTPQAAIPFPAPHDVDAAIKKLYPLGDYGAGVN